MIGSVLAYGDIIAANIRAARARAGLSGSVTAARMQAFGFRWRQQTVPDVERGTRRVTAEEIMALAWVFGTAISDLMSPHADEAVKLPSGDAIAGESVKKSCGHGLNDRAVTWGESDTPVFS